MYTLLKIKLRPPIDNSSISFYPCLSLSKKKKKGKKRRRRTKYKKNRGEENSWRMGSSAYLIGSRIFIKNY